MNSQKDSREASAKCKQSKSIFAPRNEKWMMRSGVAWKKVKSRKMQNVKS